MAGKRFTTSVGKVIFTQVKKGENMLSLINLNYLVNSVVFSLVGFIMLGLGFYIFDKLTPWKLWKEIIEEQNISLAIIVAAMVLGISYIIASSITG